MTKSKDGTKPLDGRDPILIKAKEHPDYTKEAGFLGLVKLEKHSEPEVEAIADDDVNITNTKISKLHVNSAG